MALENAAAACLESRRSWMRDQPWKGLPIKWQVASKERTRFTVRRTGAWQITWWWGEKWVFYHYSWPLWQHEKTKKAVESGRLGTWCSLSGAVVLWWICLASHPKKRSWLMMCFADGSLLALKQLCIWYTGVWFGFCFQANSSRFRENGPQLLCGDRASLTAHNLAPPYVQCMSSSCDTSSSPRAKLASGER